MITATLMEVQGVLSPQLGSVPLLCVCVHAAWEGGNTSSPLLPVPCRTSIRRTLPYCHCPQLVPSQGGGTS